MRWRYEQEVIIQTSRTQGKRPGNPTDRIYWPGRNHTPRRAPPALKLLLMLGSLRQEQWGLTSSSTGRLPGHRTLRPYSGIDVLLDTFRSIYVRFPSLSSFIPYSILRFFCFTPETNYDLLARELRTSSPARPRKLRRLPSFVSCV